MAPFLALSQSAATSPAEASSFTLMLSGNPAIRSRATRMPCLWRDIDHHRIDLRLRKLRRHDSRGPFALYSGSRVQARPTVRCNKRQKETRHGKWIQSSVSARET